MRLEERVAKRGFSPMMARAIADGIRMEQLLEETKHRPVDSICNCGDCEDAYRAALRQYIQLKESGHCAYWMAQIAAAMKYIALMDMLHHFEVKAEEVNVAVKPGGNDHGTLSPERGDEIELMMQIEYQEIEDIGTIMAASNAQPEGQRGFEVGGAIVQEAFAAFDRIEAAKRT